MPMQTRMVDHEISLVPYYPVPEQTLPWYQDPTLCLQVDGRPEPYDLPRLQRMYEYLNERGTLYYICCQGQLCGDVCLQRSGEINIVIAPAYQNRAIGRRVVRALIDLAREQGLAQLTATIYAFNHQSRRMFEAAGFCSVGPEEYRLTL